MVALVNEMERRLPPSLLRTYVVRGSDHCIHRSDDLWPLQQGGPWAKWDEGLEIR